MRCSTLRGGYHTGRVLHGGRTLVDSAALCFAAPLLDLRPRSQSCVRRDPRGPYDQGANRLKNKRSLDPLDLDAGSPVTSRSIRFGLPTELPLMGFSKDRPSIVPSRGVRRPGLAFPLRPSEVSCRPPRVPSTWFCTTPTDSPPRPCRSVSPCCRSWGSPCFFPSRNGPPHSAISALRSLPPADSDGSGTSPSPLARVTDRPSLASPSPRALPPHPCLPAPCRWSPTPRPLRLLGAAARRRGLEALLHRRVRCCRLHFRLRPLDTPLGLADPVGRCPRILPPLLAERDRARVRVPSRPA
jgi:hypothetical protein